MTSTISRNYSLNLKIQTKRAELEVEEEEKPLATALAIIDDYYSVVFSDKEQAEEFDSKYNKPLPAIKEQEDDDDSKLKEEEEEAARKEMSPSTAFVTEKDSLFADALKALESAFQEKYEDLPFAMPSSTSQASFFEGELNVQLKQGRIPERRWVQLDANVLSVFSSFKNRSCILRLKIDQETRVLPTGSQENGFRILAQNRSVTFFAASRIDCHRWIQFLSLAFASKSLDRHTSLLNIISVPKRGVSLSVTMFNDNIPTIFRRKNSLA